MDDFKELCYVIFSGICVFFVAVFTYITAALIAVALNPLVWVIVAAIWFFTRTT